MNIQNLARSARLYVRSEAMVMEILLRIYASKFIFASIALLTAAMGWAFMNLAAFFYLQSIWGPVWTPLAIGLVNFAVAAIAILVAVFIHPGADLALAKDLRNISSQALEDEFQMSPGVGGLAGALGGGGDTSIVRLLLPTIIAIVTSLSRRKAAPKK